jgi:hypothetical protein
MKYSKEIGTHLANVLAEMVLEEELVSETRANKFTSQAGPHIAFAANETSAHRKGAQLAKKHKTGTYSITNATSAATNHYGPEHIAAWTKKGNDHDINRPARTPESAT